LPMIGWSSTAFELDTTSLYAILCICSCAPYGCSPEAASRACFVMQAGSVR
jgi:hypothetical protein